MVAGIERDIRENIKGRVLYGEPMNKHTSFRIGGAADIWIEPECIDDIGNCMRLSKKKHIPILITGAGTNLLVGDGGINGIVLNMRSHPLKDIRREGNAVIAASSVDLAEFLDFCQENGLAGAEFLSGIPGTIGGAVMTNAGARHYEARENWHSIGDLIYEIKVMDYAGRVRLIGKRDLKFHYRMLELEDCVILGVKCQLPEASPDDISNKRRRFMERKKATQEMGAPNAGCVFKNPPGVKESAAELIDRCGLKGLKIGGAAISQKHANFIINTGRASAGDVIELIGMISDRVKYKFGVELATEIQIV